jgi:glycosyltransferase involved in cell wall biosynthesis
MGYEVKVLTTNRSNLNPEKRYEDSFDKYEVRRIKNHVRIKNTFYPKEDLTSFFESFKPDLVFLILPGSGLPYYYLKYIDSNAKVISVFSDTTIENRIYQATGTKGNKVIFNFLKSRWYNKVFERSNLLIANTNETSQILKSTSKKNIDNKVRVYGLGFDENVYFYDENLRTDTREELGIKDSEKLIVTISRIYKGKPFGFWIEQIKDFLKNNFDFKYLLAGFNDSEFSQQIEKKLKNFGLGERLIMKKSTNPEESNSIFNAADFSLWFAPTISIQQAMATGLYAIIPFDTTLDHIISSDNMGMYYKTYEELRVKMDILKNLVYTRDENIKMNSRFSYKNILQKVIFEVS